MAPRLLYTERREYREFPLHVFRGHIHQEKRTRKFLRQYCATRAKKLVERKFYYYERHKVLLLAVFVRISSSPHIVIEPFLILHFINTLKRSKHLWQRSISK
jgi:hypothetical protein